MNKLGEKISAIRRSKGLSQEKLAEDANINLRTLQRIEKGETRPHGETLKRICKALDVPVEEISEIRSGKAISAINIIAYVLVFVLAGMLIFGQLGLSKNSSTKLITKRIQYDISIRSGELETGGWIERIGQADRVPFIDDLFKLALKGEVKTCDVYLNPLEPEQLKGLLTDTFHLVLMEPIPPYNEYDTCVVRLQDAEEIDCLRFQEEWTYNEDNMVVEKRVLGICPIVKTNKLNRTVNQPLFWVYFDDIILEK
jgi:DNA-binding XRE family transcriptional regulator